MEGTGCSTNSTLNVHQMIFKRIHVFLFKFMLMICVFNYLKSFESSSSKNNLYIVWSIHQKHENFRDGWAECQGHHTKEGRQNKQLSVMFYKIAQIILKYEKIGPISPL